MESVNLTPDQIASKVRKNKPTEMDVYPLLTSFSGRIGRRQFLTWYAPIMVLIVALAMIDIVVAGYFSLAMIWPMFALTTKRCHYMGGRWLVRAFSINSRSWWHYNYSSGLRHAYFPT